MQFKMHKLKNLSVIRGKKNQNVILSMHNFPKCDFLEKHFNSTSDRLQKSFVQNVTCCKIFNLKSDAL